MKGTMLGTIGLMAVLIGAAGCATSAEMATWRAHTTPFASGDHAFFSLKNDLESEPRVTRKDLDRARNEAWWGDLVTARPDQIVGSVSSAATAPLTEIPTSAKPSGMGIHHHAGPHRS